MIRKFPQIGVFVYFLVSCIIIFLKIIVRRLTRTTQLLKKEKEMNYHNRSISFVGSQLMKNDNLCEFVWPYHSASYRKRLKFCSFSPWYRSRFSRYSTSFLMTWYTTSLVLNDAKKRFCYCWRMRSWNVFYTNTDIPSNV